ncbi:zeta-sarcoglycan-like [Mizuhopecten yessoensis]|uniref:zeta-sarcoglycan-like n=1 Tax=Mizuhopecten yessoensis TaxID=6573 RepID=UPI000B45A752|nr:zeta-sarcoglycan-like [Mizuhopecten yessoensis]XP_021342214.1 zeta-sarcoglycan-like [Mizuhopecten yessoensis]XP_021342215.1 zeta-sarcoglycan-like [Mizuhopecten yessoensis]
MGRGKLGNGEVVSEPAEYHQPVGIYGWRKRCLYSFILFLMIMTVINLALLIWILRVLNFSVDGMGKMRITEDGILMEGEAEFVKSLYTSNIQAQLQDKPLFVESSRGIIMHARDDDNNVMSTMALGNRTLEAQCDSFEVKDHNGNTQFKVNDREVSMEVDEVRYTGSSKLVFEGSVATPTLRSPPSDPLKIESLGTSIRIHGETGINLKAPAGNVLIKSSDDILLESTDNSIYVQSRDLYLKSTKVSIPAVGRPYTGKVYQLCMCMSGRLYLSDPSDDCQATDTICQ